MHRGSEHFLHRVSIIKHHCRMVFLFVSFCIFTGCGQAAKDPLVVLPESQYAQVDRLTTTVKRGSLTPVYEGEIQLAGYEEEVYWIEDDLFRNLDAGYEAKVKSLHVQAGDQVKQGDVMLSFSSEILDKRLSENEKTKRYAQLRIEHYQKMIEIDPIANYAFDIADLKDEIVHAQVYIDDVDKIYDQLNVVAKKDGIVTYVDRSVMDGFLAFGKPLFKVASDSGYYVAQPYLSGSGDDSLKKVSFAVGERFHARSRIAEYEVEVIADPTKTTGTDNVSVSANAANITESDQRADEEKPGQPDIPQGNANDKVYFRIISGSDRIKEQTLTIYQEMEEIKNVRYVEAAALIQHENSEDIFAYKQTAEGNYIPVKVMVGNVVGEYAVIVDGLDEGDVISIPANADYRDVIKPNSRGSDK